MLLRKVTLLYLPVLFLLSSSVLGSEYRVSSLCGEVTVQSSDGDRRGVETGSSLKSGDMVRTMRDSFITLQGMDNRYRVYSYSLVTLGDEPGVVWGKLSSSPQEEFLDVRFYFYPRPASGRALKVGLRTGSETLHIDSTIKSDGGYSKDLSFFHLGKGTYRAITGFDVGLDAAKYWLEIRAAEGQSVTIVVYPFYLKASRYGSGRVYIAQGKQSLFSPSQKKKEEREELGKVLSLRSADAKWEGRFRYPVEEPDIISGFGKKRVYYIGKKRAMTRYHRGVDFRGETGDPVLAPADGVVIFASKRITTGNTLVIDHGQGVFSLFFHLDSIGTPEGTAVTRGIKIAEIGATGITEGSHLHWGVLVDGVYVDPVDWIKLKF